MTPSHDTPTATPRSADAPATAGRALVIDDESTIRAALRRFFARRGWAMDEAEDGRVGLQKLLASPADEGYDVVLCDLRMPVLSGIELYAAVARARPELLARLIFSSGDVASAEAASFLATTRCRVLEKPFQLSTLGEVVDRMRAGLD